MSLTTTNMQVNPTGNVVDYDALAHDVRMMNRRQLRRYVRAAFLNTPDLDLLPLPFWQAFSPYSERKPSASEFFADIYTSVGTGPRDPTERKNVRYRGRLTEVLQGILRSCLQHRDSFTPELATLTREAIETVRNIQTCDGEDSPMKQFSAKLLSEDTLTGELAMQLAQQVGFPWDHPLYELADAASRRLQARLTVPAKPSYDNNPS